MNSKLTFLTFSLALLLLGSCTGRIVYSEYRSLPLKGWEADSVLRYNFCITDTLTPYDIIISVRHTQHYRYQNMWLFVTAADSPTVADSISMVTDTIEFFLADERGRWLGNGYGNTREMPVLYGRQTVFPHSGDYSILIQQAMRDTCLRGISDVGVIIEKSHE